MTRQHLARVAILVPDYEAGLAFYNGALGFAVEEDTDLGAGKRWVVLAPPGASPTDARILLARAVGKDQRSVVGKQAGGRVGLFLHTDDFASDHARLLERGVVFEEEPRDEPYGRVAVFRDPFGNRWDLLQPS